VTLLSPTLFNLALKKGIQSIQMVPSGIKIDKELNILAYGDDIVLIGKNEIRRNKTTFCRNGKCCQKSRTTDKPRKNKIYDSGKKNTLKQNKIGHLKIKNYKFKRVENFKYLGVIFNEDRNHKIHLQERIKNANKTYLCYKAFPKNKPSKKLKLILKNTIIDKTLTYALETSTLTKRDRKQLNRKLEDIN
jgi:hypothetical protein